MIRLNIALILLTGGTSACSSHAPQSETQFRSLASADIHLTPLHRHPDSRQFGILSHKHQFVRNPAGHDRSVPPTPYDVKLATDYSACDLDTTCSLYNLGSLTEGGFVEFNVDAPAPGSYLITIHYLSAEDSVVELAVNGTQQASVPLSPSKDPYAQQGSAVGGVTFPLGKSVLKFTMNGNSYLNISGFTIGPNLDRGPHLSPSEKTSKNITVLPSSS